MTHTDPLTGARYPDSSDSPNVSQYIQNAVNDLSDLIGGKFTTTSARDTAFTAWVAQGNAMSDGLTCRVGGYQQVYRGGSWHGVSPIAYTSTTADTTIYTTTHDLITVSVADPLFPYKIHASGSVLLAVSASQVTIAPRIRVNGTALNPQGPNAGSGSNIMASTWGTAISGSLTGASTVTLSMEMIISSSGFGYQAANPASQNSLSVLVVPA